MAAHVLIDHKSALPAVKRPARPANAGKLVAVRERTCRPSNLSKLDTYCVQRIAPRGSANRGNWSLLRERTSFRPTCPSWTRSVSQEEQQSGRKKAHASIVASPTYRFTQLTRNRQRVGEAFSYVVRYGVRPRSAMMVSLQPAMRSAMPLGRSGSCSSPIK